MVGSPGPGVHVGLAVGLRRQVGRGVVGVLGVVVEVGLGLVGVVEVGAGWVGLAVVGAGVVGVGLGRVVAGGRGVVGVAVGVVGFLVGVVGLLVAVGLVLVGEAVGAGRVAGAVVPAVLLGTAWTSRGGVTGARPSR
ncbi:Uncharacterised protein [Dermatophilus congolensis]|uniref:Uncharacterized protein n=1 Tax=Dermatophilus congolensis TaxID=1863 RepID=A0A239V9Z0_9MICO|nr:Uncharacterised protein [Dermatophilus congolensis]